jgi:hypothetical protein
VPRLVPFGACCLTSLCAEQVGISAAQIIEYLSVHAHPQVPLIARATVPSAKRHETQSSWSLLRCCLHHDDLTLACANLGPVRCSGFMRAAIHHCRM